MKISKNIIIPVTAIVVLSLYLIFNTTGKMNYEIPEFNSIDPGSINNIQIKSNKDTIDLYSDKGIWKIKPDNLRAEPSKIDEMLTFLENPQFIDMVSNSKNYQNYGLTEDKYVEIKAIQKDSTNDVAVRELYLGDFNKNKKFAFIRRSDKKSVFTVKENIKKLFDVTSNDLLDKKILDFDYNQINKIDIISGSGKTTINKSVDSDNKDIWKNDEGSDVDANSIGQSLRYLANARFESYTYDGGNNSDDTIFKINLYNDKIVNSFTILNKTDTGYLGNSSFTVKNFSFAENSGNQIIKMFEELIKKE